MRAFGLRAAGEAPTLLDLPSRAPAKGEIAVAIEACGLNFADLLIAEGRYQERPDPPVVLGMELAGRVVGRGPETADWPEGTQVAIFAGSGGLAETGCFPENRAVRLPVGMPMTAAAGFQVAYGTGHVALSHRARLRPGETLLVLGAAGGVGLAAVEIGKALGARVIAVASGPDRLAAAAGAGADHLVDAAADLRAEVRALGGADVVYDPVGGAAFDAALRAANPEARVVVIGFASGEVPQIRANHLLVKNVDVIGFYWGGYLAFRPEVVQASLRTLFGWYAEGRIRPRVSHVLPLERAAEALGLLRDRKAVGKVVVTV